jgi:hypothetical protein
LSDQVMTLPAVGTYLASRSGDNSTALYEPDVMDSIVVVRSATDRHVVLAGVRPNTSSREVLIANLDAQFRPLYRHEQEALDAYLANAELAARVVCEGPWEIKVCPGCRAMVADAGVHRCYDGSGRSVYPEHLQTYSVAPQPASD